MNQLARKLVVPFSQTSLVWSSKVSFVRAHFATGKRVLTKFEKDERLRRVLPLPWIAFASYYVATWVKSSYSLLNDDYKKDLTQLMSSNVDKKQQVDALMNLIEYARDTGKGISVPNVHKLFFNGLLGALKKSIQSTDLFVLETAVFLTSLVTQEPAAARLLASDEELVPELARLLNFALPLDLSHIDELKSKEASPEQPSKSHKTLVEDGISVEFMLLWPLINVLAGFSHALDKEWTSSGPGPWAALVSELEKVCLNCGVPVLKGFDADLLTKISVLLRMLPDSMSQSDSHYANHKSSPTNGSENEISRERIGLAMHEIHRSILEILHNVSRNKKMVHMLVDKVVISNLTSIAQNEANPREHQLIAANTTENILRFYKQRYDHHKAQGDLDDSSEKFGRIGKTGLSFSLEDNQWCKHQWYLQVPSDVKVGIHYPLVFRFPDEFIRLSGLSWGATRGLMDYYSQRFLPQALKQSFFQSVGITALKTMLGADLIFIFTNNFWPKAVSYGYGFSSAIWDPSYIHKKKEVKDERMHDYEVIALTGFFSALQLGFLYGVFQFSPYSFAPFAFWTITRNMESIKLV